LRVYKSIKRYDKNRPFATWLLSIAAHYCIDKIRKQRMKIVSMEDLPHLYIPDDSPGPESIISRSDEQNRVRNLLDSLSPTDRAAVVMYYWYDFSYDEIAESLSLSMSAVKSRLHRARRSMAQKWQDESNQAISAERRRHGERSPAF
jgi:RNA polymerase sigma-70 factor (ECF subfamily)